MAVTHKFFFALIFGALVGGTAWADDDANFLKAREAQSKGQMERFNQYARKVDQEHPLQTYLRYWRIKGTSATTSDMEDFIGQYPDSPLAERLRLELARQAGLASDWPRFQRWSSQLTKPDAEMTCHGLRARLAAGDPAVAQEGARLYRTGRDLPSSCAMLFDTLTELGALRVEDRLARLRLAIEAGNLRLAREINGALPEAMRFPGDSLARAERDPARMIQDAPLGTTREIVFHALNLVAKNDPAQAAMLWDTQREKYSEAEQTHGWGLIAVQAAKQLHPEAANWFLRAGPSPTEIQAVWKARTMLRAGRWPDVVRTILAMPEPLQEEAVWRYWKARALKSVGAQAPANALFARLSREIHYYGVLAAEELPVRFEPAVQDYRPNPEELRVIRDLPGIDRALRLRKLGLMVDATSEWLWALRGMNDTQLLAAAEIARQETWYDRAINTAESTRDTHSFDLRYLTPYRDLAESYARRQNIDPAWVFGLMRQESRFIDYARSSAGALGLMQIMPATARWIAQRMGEPRAHAGVREPETNIRFGTFYLKSIHERLGGSPVLATAAYNAGPGRARKWQASVPLEGAIYIESIPFAETREYVKKVLVNAVFYGQRLGMPTTRLKDRLGIIPARGELPPDGEGGADI